MFLKNYLVECTHSGLLEILGVSKEGKIPVCQKITQLVNKEVRDFINIAADTKISKFWNLNDRT